MSLFADLRVNRTSIGDVQISRVTNVEDAVLDADTVSFYTWSVMDHRSGKLYEGGVHHRYGDGAYELLAKVFIHVSHKQNGWD